MNMNERLNELLMDADFQEKSKSIQTKDELKILMGEFGLDMTPEQIDSFLIELGLLLSNEESDELTDSDLDDVAGGGLVTISLTGAAAAAFGIACGVTIGVGALAVGGYLIYKTVKKKK